MRCFVTTDDPLVTKLRNPQYALMSNQEAADAINSEVVKFRRPASTASVKSYAIREGFWADIDEGCDDSNTSVRRVCRNVRAWIEDPANKLPTVDLDSAAAMQWIDALVMIGKMTSLQKQGLLALGDAECSWPESVGLPMLGVGLVSNARKAMLPEVTANAQ